MVVMKRFVLVFIAEEFVQTWRQIFTRILQMAICHVDVARLSFSRLRQPFEDLNVRDSVLAECASQHGSIGAGMGRQQQLDGFVWLFGIGNPYVWQDGEI